MTHHPREVSAALLLFALCACSSEKSVVEAKGSCADVFKGQICTWATTRGDTLLEAGATVPLTTIENAPADHPFVWPPVVAAAIDMPATVTTQTGITQLTVFWEQGGHPPGAYMTPHFDFHFYSIAESERMAIDCKDLSKPAVLPASYGLPDFPLPPEMIPMMGGVPALVGLCVPNMGMHALLSSEIERTDPFASSMVVGYYKSAPIFIEPMLSKAMLMQKQSFDLPVPEIPGQNGVRPTKFRATYDTAQQAYRFTFSEFRKP
jgi:hypothetical protein